MKEVRLLQRAAFKPAELSSALHALAERGAILIDKDNPEYVFFPVPPEIKARDKGSRSTTSSSRSAAGSLSTSWDSASDSTGHPGMPDFFARMNSCSKTCCVTIKRQPSVRNA